MQSREGERTFREIESRECMNEIARIGDLNIAITGTLFPHHPLTGRVVFQLRCSTQERDKWDQAFGAGNVSYASKRLLIGAAFARLKDPDPPTAVDPDAMCHLTPFPASECLWAARSGETNLGQA